MATIIKFARQDLPTKVTWYVGYPKGVSTHSISNISMELMVKKYGDESLYIKDIVKTQMDCEVTLVDKTRPKFQFGFFDPDDINIVMADVKYDDPLNKTVQNQANQISEAIRSELKDPLGTVKDFVKRLVSERAIVDVTIDPNDKNMINIQIKIPLEMVNVEITSGGSNENSNSGT